MDKKGIKSISKQNKVIVATLMFLLTLMIGYSIFGESINLLGTAKAEGNLNLIFEKVDFDNIRDMPNYDDAKVKTEISSEGHLLTISNVNLEFPTAYVIIPVTIKNTGTINAKLTDIVPNLPNSELEFSYTNMAKGEILNAGNSKVVYLKLMWKKESITTPGTVDFTVDLVYEQTSDKEEVTVPSTPPPVVTTTTTTTVTTTKKKYDTGEEIQLGTEKFYVIEDDGTTVTAMAMYNLLVGQSCNTPFCNPLNPISPDTEGYGLQNENAKGHHTLTDGSGTVIGGEGIGLMSFSNDEYWKCTPNDGCLGIKPGYELKNVFDSNSNLYAPVKNYENYLKGLGKSSVVAKLATKDQLVNLGCDIANKTCSSAPFWVRDRIYWTGSIDVNDQILYVTEKNFTTNTPTRNNLQGVRPVITINKSEI